MIVRWLLGAVLRWRLSPVLRLGTVLWLRGRRILSPVLRLRTILRLLSAILWLGWLGGTVLRLRVLGGGVASTVIVGVAAILRTVGIVGVVRHNKLHILLCVFTRKRKGASLSPYVSFIREDNKIRKKNL